METGKEKVVDVSPGGRLTVRQAATAEQFSDEHEHGGNKSLNKEFFQQGLAADTVATGAAGQFVLGGSLPRQSNDDRRLG